jgi:predicted metal-dependent phosphoesterase TrpH
LNKTEPGKRWLKAELHAHCSLDPIDYPVCRYSAEELICSAAELGYQVLAITCHDVDVWTEGLSEFAGSLGITLIPGMEVTTELTRHTLVYNFDASVEDLDTLKKIRSRSSENTLVIAPHAFFPGRSCLRNLLKANLDVFDAIEYSGFQVRGLNFNRLSKGMAEKANKPLVGSGDIHYLWQLNRTFAWIYSEPEVISILRAVKQGRVKLETSPLSWPEAAGWWTTTIWRKALSLRSRQWPERISRAPFVRPGHTQ